MQRLADISAFEGLQNTANRSMGLAGDIHVFNIDENDQARWISKYAKDVDVTVDKTRKWRELCRYLSVCAWHEAQNLVKNHEEWTDPRDFLPLVHKKTGLFRYALGSDKKLQSLLEKWTNELPYYTKAPYSVELLTHNYNNMMMQRLEELI